MGITMGAGIRATLLFLSLLACVLPSWAGVFSTKPVFTPSAIFPGDSSVLSIELYNDTATELLGVNFTLTLPSGLRATAISARSDCHQNSQGFSAQLVGDTGIRVEGLNMPDKTYCVVSANVTSQQTGEFLIPKSSFSVGWAGGGTLNDHETKLTVKPPDVALVDIAPASIDFGAQPVGTRSAPRQAVLSNSGTKKLLLQSITANGEFTVSGCAVPELLPGQSCTLAVEFAPLAKGTRAGSVQIASDTSGSPHALTLVGVGAVPEARLMPTSVSFGTIAAGTQVSATVTLDNPGLASLAVGAIGISGSAFGVTHACPATLAPGASCALQVTYAPAAPGAHDGILSVASNAEGSPTTAAVSGNATTPPAPGMQLSSTSVTFPGQDVGSSSAPQSVVLTNNGDATLVLGTITASGDFSVTGCAGSLAPAQACTLSIVFRPTATGSRAGTVTIESNASGGARTISLSGTGLQPVQATPNLVLSRASVDFGSQVVGATSGTQSVVISNTGTGSLTLASIAISGDFAGSGCDAPVTLAPGASCTLQLTFTPTASGARSGLVTISNDAPNAPHEVALSGSGLQPVQPTPILALSRASVDFGAQVVGTTSGPQSVVISNTGTGPLALASITVSGDFTGSGCNPPITLASGTSCTMQLTFKPTASGARTGTVTIASDAPNAPHQVALTGTGQDAVQPPPLLALSRSSMAFGSQDVRSTSAPQALVISNTGSGPLQLSAITISGDFAGGGCNAPGTLAPGASCTLQITFTPIASGVRDGMVTITSNAPNAPHHVSLSGTGVTRSLALTPGSVSFGTLLLGDAAVAQLTLSNTGSSEVALRGISVSGVSFRHSHTCPTTLPVGGACTIAITFAPQSIGAHGGLLSVDSSAGSAQQVVLSGNASATPVAALEISHESLDFGARTERTASLPRDVVLLNAGTAPLHISAIQVAGDFGFKGCATPLVLQPQSRCTLAVTFLPTRIGSHAGEIRIASDAVDNPHRVSLFGSGIPAPVPGIAIAPTSADFGSLVVGQRTTARVAVSNTGEAPLILGDMATTGGPFSHSTNCPAVVAPKEACEITLEYAPRSIGTTHGELRVASNAAPAMLVVPLTGTALSVRVAAATFSATSVAFAPQQVGTSSEPRKVILTNSGTTALEITRIATEGDFGYAGCGFPSLLAVGETCEFDITFRPLGLGAHTGYIDVTTNAAPVPQRIALSGQGVSINRPEVSLAPTAADFPATRVGRSETRVLRLTSAGAQALAIRSISLTGGPFGMTHDCPALLPVAQGCNVSITYAPDSVGVHNAQLRLDTNAVPNPYITNVSGVAIDTPPPVLAVERVLDFGTTVTGTVARRTLSLSNRGGGPLVISGLRWLGSSAFSSGGRCGTIAAGASCELTITFAPKVPGEQAARLDIVSNHAGGVVQVEVVGEGIDALRARVRLSAEGLGFGTHFMGSPSPARTLRITSTGNAPLHIQRVEADGDFLVRGCPRELPPGEACDLEVRFQPLAPGPRSGSVTIVSNAEGSPHRVSAIGIGCRFFTAGTREQARLCAP